MDFLYSFYRVKVSEKKDVDRTIVQLIKRLIYHSIHLETVTLLTDLFTTSFSKQNYLGVY